MSIAVTHVSGIGPKLAEVLAKHKIKTVAALIQAGEAELAKVPGISSLRAKAFVEAAQQLVGQATKPKVDQEKSQKTKAAKKKAKKKDKKDKKKDRKKDKKKDKKKREKKHGKDKKKRKKNKKNEK